MKGLMWVILLLLLIALVGFGIYESQPVSTIPASTATTTASALPDIIPGVPSVMYQDPQYGFSIYYPSTTILKTTGFEGYLPLTQTPVVALTLDPALFSGTNLGEAGVYIGATTTPSIVAVCTEPSSEAGETAPSSTASLTASSTASINGTTFSVFDSTGAGAGNIYQEKVFRTVRNGTCFELAELLHSSEIANYPAGTVTAFDEAKFSGILDAMVNTFAFK